MLETLNGKTRSREAPGSTVIVSTFLLHQSARRKMSLFFVNCNGNEMALKMGKQAATYVWDYYRKRENRWLVKP